MSHARLLPSLSSSEEEWEMFDMLFSSYSVAIVKAGIVRFENSKGWYEEVPLTAELALWILKKHMEVRYQ